MIEFTVFIFGLSIGSFLNVLIDRLPKGKTVWGRSHCDWCKKTLRWYELIPIASWIMQKGRCRHCHRPLSLHYPLVELGTGIGFVMLYSMFHDSFLQLFAYLVIFSALVVIFVADLTYQIIPDSMVFVGIMGVVIRGIDGGGTRVENVASGFGAALFFFLLWLVTHGRGMGFGDIKLAGFLGMLLGFPKIVIALYAAFLTGAVGGVILILLRKKSLKSKISFGPFLILGTVTALMWGDTLVTWWKGLV